MKYLYVVMILFLFALDQYAQKVSVELSLQWQKNEHDYFKDVDMVPYLHITYRNGTDNPVYFPKAIQDFNDLPDFDCELYYPCPDLQKIENRFIDQTNNQFVIEFGPYEWEAFNDSVYEVIQKCRVSGCLDERQPYEGDGGINCDLSDIYRYIRSISPEKERSSSWAPEPFTADNILNTSMKRRFIFLDPGESVSFKFNLIGFKVSGGDFRFFVDEAYLDDFPAGFPRMIMDERDNKVKLPEQVGCYNLYSDKVLTNEVLAKFVGLKYSKNNDQ